MLSFPYEIIEDPSFPVGKAWNQRHFNANETLIQEGIKERSIFLIKQGSVRVSGQVEMDGNHLMKTGLCDLNEGELFGEQSLFSSQPRSASVVAITDGELIEIDCEQLNDYLEGHPETGYRLLKGLFESQSRRLRKANLRIENLFSWGLKAHRINS